MAAQQSAKFTSGDRNKPAVFGENTAGGTGLSGVSDIGDAVKGESKSGDAVVGVAEAAPG